jgi:uncharacterized damage-inducible protein DinB
MNNSRVLHYLITALVISVAFTFGSSVFPSHAQQQQQAVKELPKDRATILVAEWTRARLGVKEYIEAMPEDAIGFKPTPEIRSFAEQMLHLAGGNYMFAAVASGKENPWDFTKGKDPVNVPELKATKAALLKFVMESYDFAIEAVKGLTSAQLDEVVQLFNMKMPRHMLLAKGIEHAAHHRGQTTIYLRLKGITPPSERLF